MNSVIYKKYIIGENYRKQCTECSDKYSKKIGTFSNIMLYKNGYVYINNKLKKQLKILHYFHNIPKYILEDIVILELIHRTNSVKNILIIMDQYYIQLLPPWCILNENKKEVCDAIKNYFQ